MPINGGISNNDDPLAEVLGPQGFAEFCEAIRADVYRVTSFAEINVQGFHRDSKKFRKKENGLSSRGH